MLSGLAFSSTLPCISHFLDTSNGRTAISQAKKDRANIEGETKLKSEDRGEKGWKVERHRREWVRRKERA